MLYPAPTTPIDPSLARGTLESVQPGQIVATFPNTSYQLHLRVSQPVTTEVGKRLVGVIRADARRIDSVDTGGKYVEPLFGAPRRIQGRVIATSPSTNTLTVDAGVTIHLRLTDARQTAAQFNLGDMVTCDVREGASFTPAH